MAPENKTTGWLKGRVKAVPSGDSLVIMGNTKSGLPPEKTITLSSLIAPRLARRGGVDEPFAWDGREYLRKLCIGKDVTFKVEYTVSSIGREFGSVFIGDTMNVAFMVVENGWAKVRKQDQSKSDASPYLEQLMRLEEQAITQKRGMWNQEQGASEASIRDLPPSPLGNAGNFNAMGLLESNKGKPLHALVEQARDGSTLRVYLLPEFQFVQVFVAGIQAPQMFRRSQEPAAEGKKTSGDVNGEDTPEPEPARAPDAPLNSAQKLAASSESPDPFAREAKHFTEIRVLHREVRIVLEGVDKYSNLIGSVYYSDGDTAKDLALELVENGLAKYMEWSASMLEADAKLRLMSADIQSKKTRLGMFTNYVPPKLDSKAIQNQNFTGKVVEVVSAYCVVVADDSIPFGSPLAERRVNLSSITSYKIGDERREDGKPDPWAREAKEFLRGRVIGRQVNVSLEYSRRFNPAVGSTGPGEARVMDFGSVFIASPPVKEGGEASSPAAGSQAGVNVAELMVARGYAVVVRHKDFEARSNFYDALVAAEYRAIAGKKAKHSKKEPLAMHIADLTTMSSKKTRDFLPFLQRKRLPAVVEYVFSGHRYKLFVPKETCSIAFSLSGVRCPARGEPFSDEAIAFMRRNIMQRDVEIEVETIDRNGTFLGSLWESKANVGAALLEAGLAKLQNSFGTDRISEYHILAQAEQSAKKKKLKIWEHFIEGEEASTGSTPVKRQKEELKVTVTEVLGGGKFYVQTIGDQRVSSIQQQLASLTIKDAPIIGAFNPTKGDTVLAQFSGDNSWNRAMIVNAPRAAVGSPTDKFEVFYIDYGNQEEVSYSQLRPVDPSVSSAPGLAQLCSLAHIKVPTLEEDYGHEAAFRLSELTLNGPNNFRAIIEEKDTSGGKMKGQGTGTILVVTLVDTETDSSINAALLKDGLARLEKRRKRWGAKENDELVKYQEEARTQRIGMWEYGDIQSDDEDTGPSIRKPGGRR